jgi:hypothetical protein
MDRGKLVGAIAVALVAGGCGTGRHVQRGIDMYRAGAYQPAMQHWLSIQALENDFNQKGLCRYLVFRGLTHHRLGDAQAAKHFLTRAQPVCAGDPRFLDPPTVAEMNAALGGAAPGPAGPGPSTPTAPGGPTPPAPGEPSPGPAPVEEPGS